MVNVYIVTFCCTAKLKKGTAMAKPKQRLVADPSIGVTDLLQCVECWLDEKGTSNLLKELEPPSGTGWKTAVGPSWVAKLGGLWKKFIAIAPNGVIPSKKNRTALEKLQDRREVNKGKRSAQDFAELCDEWIRIGLAQLRSCKQSQITRSRTMRKAGPDEQEVINELISMLTDVPEENEENLPSPKTELVSKESASPSSSIVVVTTPPLVEDVAEDVDPLSIFEAINKKPTTSESPAKATTSPLVSRKQSASSGSQWMFEGFAAGLKSMGYLTEEDQKIMTECSNQPPINQSNSTQLQRANKAQKRQQEEEDKEEEEEPKENKDSTKQAGKAAKDGAKKKHEIAKPKAKAKTLPNKKKKKKKQEEPETPQAEDDTVQTSQKKKKKKKKHPTKKKTSSEAPEERSTNTSPHGFDPEVTRAVNRKRYTSRAWHSAYDLAISQGFSQEDSRQKGREASQKASQDFVGLWPLSPTKKKKKKTKENQAEAIDAD